MTDKTAKSSSAVTDFWRLFEEKCRALEQITSADDPLYDELLVKLQGIDSGLFFEFATAPGECELIITAEGNKSLFGLVDAVVAAAPRIRGWKVFALKPKLGFPESVEWAGRSVEIADVVFDPLSQEGSDELGLRLMIPGIGEEDVEDAHNALLRALDHGLGERKFAEAVQYIEAVPLDGPADKYIALTDLESFIEWRAKQRKH
jgi:hypothetical protein